MRLIDLQRDMRTWLHSGDAAGLSAPAMRAGLAVYQNNYRAQLIECLETSFPVTRDWLGDATFRSAAACHIDALPPSSWTLDAYPRDVPAMLGRLYPDDAEVAELATLELALAEAFVAADADVLDAPRLAGVDWDRAVLRFVPSFDVHDVSTNAPAIWSAIINGDRPPAAAMLPETAGLLVWRQDDVSRFRTTDRTEMQAILRARAGAPFADLCTYLVDDLGEAEGVAAAGRWLGQWIGEGLITTIEGESPCVD